MSLYRDIMYSTAPVLRRANQFYGDYSDLNSVSKPSDSEMQYRVEKNNEIYRKVCDIMNNDDDTDKMKLLQKFLDEKLTKKILKDDSWQKIDYQEFLDSIERKAATANLELLDIELPSEGLMTSLVKHTKGNLKKKSTSYIVVCDRTESSKEQVKVTFNKELKKVLSDTCQTQGQILKVNVGETFVKHSIGLNDNHHDFYMLKLPCDKSFFKDIEQSFSIKKGEIVVFVPEEADVLTFGSGSNILSIPLDNKVIWTDDARLEVPVVADDDKEQICFEVDFGSQQIKVTLKLHIAKPIPPAKPGSVEGTYVGGNVIVDGQPRAIYSYWKKYSHKINSFKKKILQIHKFDNLHKP